MTQTTDDLTRSERLALTVALSRLGRGLDVGPSITAVCVLALERLVGPEDAAPEEAD